MERIKIDVLTDSETEEHDLNKSLIVITDGHPNAIGIQIQRQGQKTKRYSESLEQPAYPSTLFCEARALVKGVRLATKQWNGKDDIVVANDNSDLVRYAKLYCKNGNGDESGAVIRYQCDPHELKMVNGLLDGILEITDKYPIAWAEIKVRGPKDQNRAHKLCRNAKFH
jgi:hypothetical protein